MFFKSRFEGLDKNYYLLVPSPSHTGFCLGCKVGGVEAGSSNRSNFSSSIPCCSTHQRTFFAQLSWNRKGPETYPYLKAISA
jgi:hypothetical protein